jgi:YVTN family beta-propeller protein
LVARLTHRLAAICGALAVAGGLVTALAPAASADSTTYLNAYLGPYERRGGDVAAGGGKVFVAVKDRIVVTDSQGRHAGAITGLSGAMGLAVTPDGTRLYAALSGSNEVAEIDTSGLTITGRINLAAYPCPSNLSLSGNRLWVGYGCTGTWGGGVISLDISAPASPPVKVGTSMYSAPLVAAAGNTLVVGEWDASQSDLMVYDVSVTPATLRGVIDGQTNHLGSLHDLTITPDGSMAVSAFNTPYGYVGWDTTSLTKAHHYGVGGDPQAVAVSPDGAYVAGGSGSVIALYDAATSAQIHTGDSPAGALVPGNLAFAGSDIFGVLRDPYTSQLYLWRMQGATLPASTLTLTAPSEGTAYEPLTMTGRLTVPDGSAPGAQPLSVTRRLPDGRSTTLSVTTAEDGTFTITDTPRVGGAITYDVFWAGSSDFRWSTASATVTVAKRQSTLTLSGPAAGKVGKELNFKGALDVGKYGPIPGSSLKVLRTVSNDTGTVTTPLGEVYHAVDGSFSFTDTPINGGQYTYTVQFAGDLATLPAQASQHVTVMGEQE